MEKYLYFTNPSSDINGTEEMAMVPSSSIFAAGPPSSANQNDNLTVTKLYIRPEDGTENPTDPAGDQVEDFINVVHALGDRKKVLKSLVQLINGSKTKSPFVVAADEQNNEFGIEGVTAVSSINYANG
tara:strand:- start:326 stop:709 length:384 start_codon:yes stop_codon:yes gene_type:complete